MIFTKLIKLATTTAAAVIFTATTTAAATSTPVSPPAGLGLGLTYLYNANITGSGMIFLGQGPRGTRIVAPITGGTFEGGRLKGMFCFVSPYITYIVSSYSLLFFSSFNLPSPFSLLGSFLLPFQPCVPWCVYYVHVPTLPRYPLRAYLRESAMSHTRRREVLLDNWIPNSPMKPFIFLSFLPGSRENQPTPAIILINSNKT